MAGAAIDPDRLDVLRALADPTRNALYRELQRAPEPLTTPELAARVALHPNTVRAHLEQLRAAGLVRSDTTGDGGRGRPRHRFSAAPVGRPSPRAPARSPAGGEGPPAVELARALVEVAEVAGVDAELIRSVGRRSGRERTSPAPSSTVGEAVRRIVEVEAASGYGPVVDELPPGRWRLTFSSCPYRELADEAPEVVCSLHAGSIEGMCAATARVELESFTTARRGEDCHAVLCERVR
jgi:predicted ArsR family transcriptional regulator